MKLDEYFKTNCIKITWFAKKHGISVGTLNRILSGFDIRLSTALFIEEITNGKVKCKDMKPTQNEPDSKK